MRLHALTGFALNSPNARRLVPFYEQAFGAQLQRRERPDEYRSMQWTRAHGGVVTTVLSVGDEVAMSSKPKIAVLIGSPRPTRFADAPARHKPSNIYA